MALVIYSTVMWWLSGLRVTLTVTGPMMWPLVGSIAVLICLVWVVQALWRLGLQSHTAFKNRFPGPADLSQGRGFKIILLLKIILCVAYGLNSGDEIPIFFYQDF